MENPRPPPQKKSDLIRKFSLISYCDEDFILGVLDLKKEVISHFAYSFHDMDKYDDGRPKEPHFHILILTHNALCTDTILKWFDSAVDDNGVHCNTFIEPVRDIGYLFRYLWHGNKADRHKFQYSFDRVVCDDITYWRKYQVEKVQYDDKLLSAYNDLKNGLSFGDCIQKYGRDFIIHSRSLMYCLNMEKAETFKFTQLYEEIHYLRDCINEMKCSSDTESVPATLFDLFEKE